MCLRWFYIRTSALSAIPLPFFVSLVVPLVWFVCSANLIEFPMKLDILWHGCWCIAVEGTLKCAGCGKGQIYKLPPSWFQTLLFLAVWIQLLWIQLSGNKNNDLVKLLSTWSDKICEITHSKVWNPFFTLFLFVHKPCRMAAGSKIAIRWYSDRMENMKCKCHQFFSARTTREKRCETTFL